MPCMAGPTSTPSEPNCSECGAPHIDGFTCWDLLGLVLSWETHDADLAGEHFFTVACYNLQHPAQFTDTALAQLREGFIARLDQGTAIIELRRRASAQFEGKMRVLKPKAERRPTLRQWDMTLADVYADGQAEGAAERVRQWASVIRHTL